MTIKNRSGQSATAIILDAVRPFRKQNIWFFITSGLGVAAFTAAPFAIRNMLNEVSAEGAITSLVWWYIGLFAILRFSDEWLWRIAEYIVRGYLPQLMERVRSQLFESVIHKKHTYFVNSNSGQIGYWVNNAAQKVSDLLEDVYWTLWNRLVGFIATFAFLCIASWKLAVVFSVWFVALFLVIGMRSRTQSAMVAEQSEAQSRTAGRVIDSVANNLPLRISNAHGRELRGLRPFQDEFVGLWRRSWKYGLVGNVIKGNSAALVSVLALVMVVKMYAAGEVGIGDIALLVTYVTTTSETIWDLSFMLNRFVQDYGSLKNSLLNIHKGGKERTSGKELKAKTLGVSFKNLDFAYPDQPEQKVLNGLNLDVKPGEHVGVVGHSGAGKSTLVGLILGLYDPTGGKLSFNGQDSSKLTPASMRDHAIFVPQDTSLFNRTIRENIEYGAGYDVTTEQLEEAMRRAQAYDFIQGLPQGLESLVGERGVKLSGGQRQRIAICRAMLSKAPLIVLDEATSALDSVSEQAIQKALNEVMKNRTALVIAHRLSTLKHLDRIVVVENGHVAESGTHDELIAKDGVYADLWKRQRNGFIGE